jgi:hypothetical protein
MFQIPYFALLMGLIIGRFWVLKFRFRCPRLSFRGMLWGEASCLGCTVSLQGIIFLFWDFKFFVSKLGLELLTLHSWVMFQMKFWVEFPCLGFN